MRMKAAGFIILAVGLISGAASLSMDTTVGVENQVNGWTQVERMHNIERMDQRRNWLIASGFIALDWHDVCWFWVSSRRASPGDPGDAYRRTRNRAKRPNYSSCVHHIARVFRVLDNHRLHHWVMHQPQRVPLILPLRAFRLAGDGKANLVVGMQVIAVAKVHGLKP